MKFNFEDYKGKYVMHCKTEGEAIDFCKTMHNNGMKWGCGESYLIDNWDVHRESTCYNFNIGTYWSVGYYKGQSYVFLEWSDFMNKEFTKSDLKSGDVILRRNGKVEIVCLETGTCILKNGYNKLSEINEDLTYQDDLVDYDIVKVYRPKEPYQCGFSEYAYKHGELVYKRDDVVRMTLKEVEDKLGIKYLEIIQ